MIDVISEVTKIRDFQWQIWQFSSGLRGMLLKLFILNFILNFISSRFKKQNMCDIIQPLTRAHSDTYTSLPILAVNNDCFWVTA